MQFYEDTCSQPETRPVMIGLTGTGAANATKRYGQGVTVTRTGVGVHRIQFNTTDALPGRFMGPSAPALGATTMTALAGYTVVFGDFDVTNKRIDFTILNGSNAAADLAAAQYIDFILFFTEKPLQ